MIVEAHQPFRLPAPEDPAALAFVRDPTRALAKVRFLKTLEVQGSEVRGVLAVQLPMLGEVTLPFFSVLEHTAAGARLLPQPLDNERAWLEVEGEAGLEGTELDYRFTFRAHLDTPSAEKWGAVAFEKMVQAAASRTLAKVARELPAAVAAALAENQP
ncbi:DUF3809 domain-containing protein [Deinococcus irradiatisoli]|uniref:DUF3809 domain-containing protein n=1 Tax=Deinococcus irradiatisoli TaxID=2202254 RepID=A0A2Z3JEL5_9DEIO|nr:DUF3809 domain-containing protein [Deinococcus irradiatisoli]AWN23482.1 DUF3809 domain-containing protein [Deinococcus irradiatisoli]